MRILLRELGILYVAFMKARRPILPEPAIQYADFAAWQRDWLCDETLEAQTEYWKKRLDGAPLALDLATDRPRPPVQTFCGATESFTIPKAQTQELKEL